MAKPTVLIEDFADMLGFDTPAPQAEPTTLPVQGGLTEMDFAIMESFPNHKFKLYEGQRLADMADSIKQFGILLPTRRTASILFLADTIAVMLPCLQDLKQVPLSSKKI